MANSIPVKFNRVAAAFDEMARLCSCESSGSEHTADLSLLVNSFFEREISDRRLNRDDEVAEEDEIAGGRHDAEIDSPDQIELRKSLNKLLFKSENDAVGRSIRAEVEAAMEEVSDEGGEFKRRLMARLRTRGLDAGLCKSSWEKNGRNQPGKYEYIDVVTSGGRHIVEVNLSGEFAVVRPTGCYADLLENFPQIFVGKPEDLKRVIGLMSKAIEKSMKSAGLNVPPWRRLGYMQAKWLGYYRRTGSKTRSGKAGMSLAGNRMVGFAPSMGAATSLFCREDFAAKNGGRISGLAAALE